MQLPRDNKDLSDPINRKNATVPEKLAWICDQAAKEHGRDPRGGGFSFVGQAAVVELVVGQLRANERRLQKMVVIGTAGAEIVAWWVAPGGQQIPFRCSDLCFDPKRTKDSSARRQIWCVPDVMLMPSTRDERRAASEIREAIYRGATRLVQ